MLVTFLGRVESSKPLSSPKAPVLKPVEPPISVTPVAAISPASTEKTAEAIVREETADVNQQQSLKRPPFKPVVCVLCSKDIQFKFLSYIKKPSD